MTTQTAVQTTKPPLHIEKRGAGDVMQATDFEGQWRKAQVFAASALVPKQYRGSPNDVVVAWQMGAELGISPMMSLNYIAVINGRASIYGNGAKAVVRAHPQCRGLKVYTEGSVEDGTATGVCEIRRDLGNGEVETSRRTFTMAQAKRAKLWGKAGPWTEYPEDMLGWRALHRAASDAFPEALCGLMLAEESQDLPAPPRNVTPPPPQDGPNGDIRALVAAREPDEVLEPSPPSAAPAAPENGTFDPSRVHKVGAALGLDEQERRDCIRAVTKRVTAKSVTAETWPAVRAALEEASQAKGEQPPPPGDDYDPEFGPVPSDEEIEASRRS